MKKIAICLLLSFSMVLGFASCASDAVDEISSAITESDKQTESETPTSSEKEEPSSKVSTSSKVKDETRQRRIPRRKARLRKLRTGFRQIRKMTRRRRKK